MELQLIEKAQQGDAASLETLFKELRFRLLRHLSRRFAQRAVAEDWTQELLLKVYAQLQEVPAEDFWTWIFTQVISIEEAGEKEEKPWSLEAIDLLTQTLLEYPAYEEELFNIYSEREENYEIQDHVDFCLTVFVKTLARQEQELFLLAEEEGFSVSQLTKILGLEPQEIQEKYDAQSQRP